MSRRVMILLTVRSYCYQCFRPARQCFCAEVPQIENDTDVLILQHVRERWHAFNTARIVQRALRNCTVVCDHNQRLRHHALPIQAGAGLLYPTANAKILTELSPSERPRQLVIVDGTWHQARTIVRDVPQLRRLPCYRLSPATPGQYRIRREPSDQSLSTLEATVEAMRALEPETAGWDRLLSAFHRMIDDQLASSSGRHVARTRKLTSRPRFVPHAMLRPAQDLVIAYGEAVPGGPDRTRPLQSPPVRWVAQRLGSSERFACCLRQPQPLSPTMLAHMRLTSDDFRDALTPEEFCQCWQRFTRRSDTLIVYHPRTYQLLNYAGARQPRSLVLKAIFKAWRPHARTLEQILQAEGLEPPSIPNQCRANERLEMAVRLVQHLRRQPARVIETSES